MQTEPPQAFCEPLLAYKTDAPLWCPVWSERLPNRDRNSSSERTGLFTSTRRSRSSHAPPRHTRDVEETSRGGAAWNVCITKKPRLSSVRVRRGPCKSLMFTWQRRKQPDGRWKRVGLSVWWFWGRVWKLDQADPEWF